MKTVYARLDAEDFKALVKGNAVELHAQALDLEVTVKLILADIGIPALRQAVAEASGVIEAMGTIEPPEPCIIPPGEPLRP
jgi:hypothetical protein